MTEPNPSEILNQPVVPAVTTHLCYINSDPQLLVGCWSLCVNSLKRAHLTTSGVDKKNKKK